MRTSRAIYSSLGALSVALIFSGCVTYSSLIVISAPSSEAQRGGQVRSVHNLCAEFARERGFREQFFSDRFWEHTEFDRSGEPLIYITAGISADETARVIVDSNGLFGGEDRLKLAEALRLRLVQQLGASRVHASEVHGIDF